MKKLILLALVIGIGMVSKAQEFSGDGITVKTGEPIFSKKNYMSYLKNGQAT